MTDPQPRLSKEDRKEIQNIISLGTVDDEIKLKMIEGVLSRSRPAPAAPERIGAIRTNVFMDDQKEWLIERVNAGMGEWEYVISYLGEYFATAPSELIAREIREAYSDRATIRNQTRQELITEFAERFRSAYIFFDDVKFDETIESLRSTT